MPFRGEQGTPTAVERESSLEYLLSTELENQCTRETKTLNEAGLLEPLPDCNEKGIIGIDGVEYPVPTVEAIKGEILANRERYETKMRQGFTRIQLVPIALPISRFLKAYKDQLLQHFKEGRLFYPPKDPNDQPKPVPKNKFDKNNPFGIWDTWNTADVDGSLLYYPEKFDKTNSGGLTKADLLQKLASTPFPGWKIELLEDTTHIPRSGQGRTKGNRKQLETNLTPVEYRQKLAVDQNYADEQGQTIESGLTTALSNLRNHNQVTDDFQGHGSINWLLGNYHPPSGRLPLFYWYRGGARTLLDGGGPGFQREYCGFRPAVGVGRLGT